EREHRYQECFRRYKRLRRLRRLPQDVPGAGHPSRPEGLPLTAHRPRRPLYGLRRVRRGLPGLRLRRGAAHGPVGGGL
ncbi:MAG: 4Fe-4S ferredoxin, iron-sulfur binding, partial [uncultured Rubrobacteraceae bacterium]